MSQEYYTTEEHQKGSHLSFEERVVIQTLLRQGKKPRAIAKELKRSPNTIINEIDRGTVMIYGGRVARYKAKRGQEVYEQHRENCHRKFKLLEVQPFIKYVESHMPKDKPDECWSPDACFGRAMREGKFKREEMVCTKTLYNYIDSGLLSIKNIDLLQKVTRKQPHVHTRENKRILGRSIDERDPDIQERKEFGHWECDLVIGAKTGDDECLLTMIERKTRDFLIRKLPNKESASVMAAFADLRKEYGDHFKEVFKTMTTDNGSEFSLLSQLEELSGTLVYFAHPYTSCEKGSIENHNGLIRRFIPKGKRIDDYSLEAIIGIELWANSLPRKILGYATPEECFEMELDKIYCAV